MKAKIKATGEIVDAVITQRVTRMGEQVYVTDDCRLIEESRLEFNVDSFDYWTRLKHQYAGMAMQGLIIRDHNIEDIVSISDEIATALMEMMKEERK